MTAFATLEELATDAGVPLETVRWWVRSGNDPSAIKGSCGWWVGRTGWEAKVVALRRLAR